MARKNSGGGMSVREAGRMGGQKTSGKYGREFYQEIGQKGGRIGGPIGGRRSHIHDPGKRPQDYGFEE